MLNFKVHNRTSRSRASVQGQVVSKWPSNLKANERGIKASIEASKHLSVETTKYRRQWAYHQAASEQVNVSERVARRSRTSNYPSDQEYPSHYRIEASEHSSDRYNRSEEHHIMQKYIKGSVKANIYPIVHSIQVSSEQSTINAKQFNC